jgi:DNA-binding GntR family transcriptional regulator
MNDGDIRLVMTAEGEPPTEDRGLHPLENPRLIDSALEAIRASILDGRFAPGERLLEMQLAQSLGISRGPLREALNLLEKDGIIHSIPRRGKFVQTFDMRTIDEVYSLRRVLEPFAVRLAIEDARDETMKRLPPAYQVMRKAVDADDARLFARLDIAFHRRIVELASHSLLARAWLENIDGKLQIILNVTTMTHRPLSDALRSHVTIMTAVEAGDAAGAEAVMRAHIDEAWDRARGAIANQAGIAPG